jgi:hypothetical protein
MSVQCIYCQQIRAKNTSRQKEHLLICPGLQNHPSTARPSSSAGDGIVGPPNGFSSPALAHNPNASMSNGMPTNSTPIPGLPNGTSLPPQPAATTPSRPTPKPLKTPKTAPGSNLPAPPLDDVHAAFVEFRAKEEDKCLSVQCIYCNQIRAKNTSRQRQHLLECTTYQNVMKESIPANNLLHRFDEGDVARSLTLPTPTLELDFRMSIKVNPKISVGSVAAGHRDWVSIVGGQWAGRWGKGIVIVSFQSTFRVLVVLLRRARLTCLLAWRNRQPSRGQGPRNL